MVVSRASCPSQGQAFEKKLLFYNCNYFCNKTFLSAFSSSTQRLQYHCQRSPEGAAGVAAEGRAGVRRFHTCCIRSSSVFIGIGRGWQTVAACRDNLAASPGGCKHELRESTLLQIKTDKQHSSGGQVAHKQRLWVTAGEIRALLLLGKCAAERPISAPAETATRHRAVRLRYPCGQSPHTVCRHQHSNNTHHNG